MVDDVYSDGHNISKGDNLQRLLRDLRGNGLTDAATQKGGKSQVMM